MTISGINIKDIGEYITVNVKLSGDDNSYSVKYNPLNYCYSVVNSDSPDSLKNVVKALYLFYTAL